jgi:hypothetical protein
MRMTEGRGEEGVHVTCSRKKDEDEDVKRMRRGVVVTKVKIRHPVSCVYSPGSFGSMAGLPVKLTSQE